MYPSSNNSNHSTTPPPGGKLQTLVKQGFSLIQWSINAGKALYAIWFLAEYLEPLWPFFSSLF